MGSGISTKYQLNPYYGEMEVRESDSMYRRVFDEDYLDEFCREMIERPEVEGSSMDKNYLKVQDKYPIRTGGNLGHKTDHTGFNNFYSDNPMKDAMELYSNLSNGSATRIQDDVVLSKFKDGDIVSFRPYTSTSGSPAVDIKVVSSSILRKQRIHFLLWELLK
jgi:hypothetical protein